MSFVEFCAVCLRTNLDVLASDKPRSLQCLNEGLSLVIVR
jgi:hypothetical protein